MAVARRTLMPARRPVVAAEGFCLLADPPGALIPREAAEIRQHRRLRGLRRQLPRDDDMY